MPERLRFEHEIADLGLSGYENLPAWSGGAITVPESEYFLAENEFRLDRVPTGARQHFSKGGSSWRIAVQAAVHAGYRDLNDLADLIFFMQYPARMAAGVGRPVSKSEPDFVKLRAEWNHYRIIAAHFIAPAGAKPACSVFLPANPAGSYETYVAKPTTGLIKLMINGRNETGTPRDQTEAYDSMQQTVESLGRGDSLFIANWQFSPTLLHLTVRRPDMKTWGDLLKKKANEGVRIRVIIALLSPLARNLRTDLTLIDNLIAELPSSARDNLKYISSPHPAALGVGSHHQKFMVARKGKTLVGYCGGLDISFNRTPDKTPPGWGGWGPDFVWHDVHAKVEGRIVRDLEKEFVLRWNREKDKTSVVKRPGWKDLEDLAPAPAAAAGPEAGKNIHKLQMLRTVSLGIDPSDIRRDDIWQGYFRLIGCATSFIFLENQYFYEPKLADAIVKQTQAQPNLIVIVVVTTRSDDEKNFFTEDCIALRHEFFRRLTAGVVPSTRLGVYTKFSAMVHSKLLLADDRLLTMGSANANPRGFFLDSELNLMLDNAEAVKSFRRRLWSHDLGFPLSIVERWNVGDFIQNWNTIARANETKDASAKMTGEGIIPFGPRDEPGKDGPTVDVLC